MGLLELLLWTGKTAADYAQKHPNDTQRLIKQFSKTSTPTCNNTAYSKGVNVIDVYYIRAYVKNRKLFSVTSFKVLKQEIDGIVIELYDTYGTVISSPKLEGKNNDYQVGKSYTF